jgi:transcriptional regulator with XRE-family HTH domain
VKDPRTASEHHSAASTAGSAVPKTFGERLREARAKTHVTQSKLSTRCGVPKTMLSRYENDHILPSVITLHKLADALGISVSALVGDGTNVIQAFADALDDVGINIQSDAEAEGLANVIADMVEEHDDHVSFLESGP